MIVNFGLRKSQGPVQYAPFMLPLRDAGSGAVNTVLARGTGSATFTRAGATATTVLSTGLVSSAIAANTARSYYDPAPTGGTGLYMFLPGVSGAYASTPDSTAVSITGDIDIRARVALDDWTPSTNQAIVSKWNSGGNAISYGFNVLTSGALNLLISASGVYGAGNDIASSVSTGFTDGTTNWIRVTWVAATKVVTFYTSSDGSSWTQLGTTSTTSAGAIFDSSTEVRVGQSSDGVNAYPAKGRIFKAEIYNGVGGTLAADFNPQRTTQASTSFTGSTGETWTVNGRGFIYAEPLYLGYLAEESRVNLVLRSEDFSAAWAAVGTPTRSGAAKTCGAVNMDLIGDDSAAALEGYTQTITYTADATKVVSFFIAQGTSTSVMVRLRDTTAPADRLLAAITWAATGLPTITMTTGTSLGYQIFPNGIFRVSLLSTSVTAANTNSLEFYPASTAALAVANTGDAYIGGVESNNAAFSTSYIPTAAATVTRAVDLLLYPSSGNIGDTAGTSFAKFTSNLASAGSGHIMSTFNGAAGGAPLEIISGNINLYDGTGQRIISGSVGNPNTAIKRLASTWAGSSCSGYINGTIGLSATFDGNLNSQTNLAIGCHADATDSINGCIRDVRILKRVLSDSEIASLR